MYGSVSRGEAEPGARNSTHFNTETAENPSELQLVDTKSLLWSTYKIDGKNPLPRYNHTANITASAKGDVFIFGGSHAGSTSDDLYILDCGMT